MTLCVKPNKTRAAAREVARDYYDRALSSAIGP
jgi:hypothetical protein